MSHREGDQESAKKSYVLFELPFSQAFIQFFSTLHGLRYITEDGRHWTERVLWSQFRTYTCSFIKARPFYRLKIFVIYSETHLLFGSVVVTGEIDSRSFLSFCGLVLTVYFIFPIWAKWTSKVE